MNRMFNIDDLTHEVLVELIECDKSTGSCVWRKRDRKYFRCEAGFKMWNSRYAGKEAFTSISSSGYFHGSIFKITLQKHRVIWFYFTGKWPENEIDHKDKNKLNNAFENLREATGKENSKNMGFTTRNTSGIVGASYRKDIKKYEVSIYVNGENKRLGYTKDLQEALEWRKEAQKELGFHFHARG